MGLADAYGQVVNENSSPRSWLTHALSIRSQETSVPIRRAVADFLAAGPLPDEEQSVEAIQRSQKLLEQIEAPVTAEEAMALLRGFGPDDCYGLPWTLLHLIETAPDAKNAAYPTDSDNPWVQLLRRRVENSRPHHE
jgi:hypothetical protein